MRMIPSVVIRKKPPSKRPRKQSSTLPGQAKFPITDLSNYIFQSATRYPNLTLPITKHTQTCPILENYRSVLIGYLPYLTSTLLGQAKFPITDLSNYIFQSATRYPNLTHPITKHTQTCLMLPYPTARHWLNTGPKRLTELGLNDP